MSSIHQVCSVIQCEAHARRSIKTLKTDMPLKKNNSNKVCDRHYYQSYRSSKNKQQIKNIEQQVCCINDCSNDVDYYNDHNINDLNFSFYHEYKPSYIKKKLAMYMFISL